MTSTTFIIGIDTFGRSVADLNDGVKKVHYHSGGGTADNPLCRTTGGGTGTEQQEDRTDGDDDGDGDWGDDRSVQSHVELFLPPTSSHTPLSPPPARFINGDVNLGGDANAVGVNSMGVSVSSLEGVDVNGSNDGYDDASGAQQQQQQKVAPHYRICPPIPHL